MAAFQSTTASDSGMASMPDVMEIGLLLPTSRINALIELSKRRQQSVGQILRGLIDRELRDGELVDPPDNLFETFESHGFGTFV
jgi:hypothetical protein